jgi:hypothetical protein
MQPHRQTNKNKKKQKQKQQPTTPGKQIDEGDSLEFILFRKHYRNRSKPYQPRGDVTRDSAELEARYRENSKIARYSPLRSKPDLSSGYSMGFITSGLASMIPQRFVTRLKYVDRFAPTPASGANFHQVFSGVSLYDPDYTGTGHQPMGFDTLATLYSNYHTHASSIRIFGIDNSASPNPAQYECSLIPSLVTSDYATADPEAVAESPFGRAKIFTVHTGNPADNYITSHMSTSTLTGLHTLTIGPGNTAWSAGITASPANGFYWHINGQVVDESTTMADVYIYVEIVYYCTFYNRVALGQS